MAAIEYMITSSQSGWQRCFEDVFFIVVSNLILIFIADMVLLSESNNLK